MADALGMIEARSFPAMVGLRGAERVGEVISSHIIARPHESIDAILPLGRRGDAE